MSKCLFECLNEIKDTFLDIFYKPSLQTSWIHSDSLSSRKGKHKTKLQKLIKKQMTISCNLGILKEMFTTWLFTTLSVIFLMSDLMWLLS